MYTFPPWNVGPAQTVNMLDPPNEGKTRNAAADIVG